jgi:DNA-binding NarL/FixJ family response regulator
VHPLEAGDLPPICATDRDIVSTKTIDSEIQSRIALCRLHGKPFTPRERQWATVALNEIAWLHWKTWPKKPTLKKLPPRKQAILDLLLKGGTRKEIAHQIGISTGTVNGYIREIYLHFKVNSHAELIKAAPSRIHLLQ